MLIIIELTFTASQSGRNCEFIYEEIKLGVYIYGISGNLYTEAEWNGQETPNGIAVLTDACRFVIALQDQGGSYYWFTSDSTVSGITITTNESAAQTDYDGEAQTTTIIKAKTSNTEISADMCRSYTFPNGKNGYLGAAGEWYAVLSNFDAIQNALTACGGNVLNISPNSGKARAGIPMEDNPYYRYDTSTQFNSSEAWCANTYSCELDYAPIMRGDGYNYVRAFASI